MSIHLPSVCSTIRVLGQSWTIVTETVWLTEHLLSVLLQNVFANPWPKWYNVCTWKCLKIPEHWSKFSLNIFNRSSLSLKKPNRMTFFIQGQSEQADFRRAWIKWLLLRVSHAQFLSCVSFQPFQLESSRLLCPWDCFRQGYWSRLPFPSPGSLPNPGLKPAASALQAGSLVTELLGKPQESHSRCYQ